MVIFLFCASIYHGVENILSGNDIRFLYIDITFKINIGSQNMSWEN